MATTFDTLTEKLAPRLQEIIVARHDDIVAGAGGFARREAVKLAFPTFLNEIPVLLRSAIELVSEEFGNMNLNDLLAFLETNAK